MSRGRTRPPARRTRRRLFARPALDDRPARFRANLFYAGGHLGGCLRVIPTDIPDFAWAGFPVELAERLAFLRDGLVIVTGPTGSGKTTTLAMIVNLLNQTGGYRIITVEEPVEYLFPRAPNSVVTQREVGHGRAAPSPTGCKSGLRQDPDVILVGEIRDRETAQMALSAAETGHLVFTTLHTRDAKGAITRYADLFPQDAQRDVRAQLAHEPAGGRQPAAACPDPNAGRSGTWRWRCCGTRTRSPAPSAPARSRASTTTC